jgi:hypothetical protein
MGEVGYRLSNASQWKTLSLSGIIFFHNFFMLYFGRDLGCWGDHALWHWICCSVPRPSNNGCRTKYIEHPMRWRQIEIDMENGGLFSRLSSWQSREKGVFIHARRLFVGHKCPHTNVFYVSILPCQCRICHVLHISWIGTKFKWYNWLNSNYSLIKYQICKWIIY